MASTIVGTQSNPGDATTRLFLSASSVSSGTPNPAGYLQFEDSGGWYFFTVPEALSGLFFYSVKNGGGVAQACGLVDLNDDTKVYLGFDPPSSDITAYRNRERQFI